MTIVAAWIRAETGVGPAIASPSHDCSGNCADFPQAARSRRRPSAVSVASPAPAAPENTVSKPVPPNTATIAMIAINSPMSPTRFTTNAFLAATALGSSRFQKPISR